MGENYHDYVNVPRITLGGTFTDVQVRPPQNRSISESTDSSDVELLAHKRDGKNSGRLSHRLLAVCVVIGVVIVTVLATIISIMFVQLGELRSELEILKDSSEDNGKICVQCSDLMTGPFDDDNPHLLELEKVEIPGKASICCAKSPTQTKTLFDMMYDKQKQIAEINGDLNANKSKCCGGSTSSSSPSKAGSISAHLLVGLQQAKAGNDNSDLPVRNWDHRDPTAHVNGIRLVKDKLSVNETGLYLIYSQVSFSIRDTGIYTQGMIPTLYHHVYRYNVIYPNGGEQLLLKSVNTQKIDPTSEFGDLTSFTSAGLLLNRGDQLYVKVSNLSYISRDPKASFFGLVKIDGG